MTLRHCFTAGVLFCVLSALVAAQGTPGGKTPILTGFTPLSEKELQDGVIRLFDGFSTFGWKEEGVRVENGRLHYITLESEDTPFWFFTGTMRLENVVYFSNIAPPRATARQITTQPRQMTSLFDGKTLAGWTLRGKAEAEVVEGAIRLTKGSGSLESEGKFGDFVLQLEYLTPVRKDKGINSGVFFRCIPGETMNGYECQILNKPGESDYEKFIGTDTGGLFRRQVGRNVGPKDGEWNYITIAARGNRMATWVNGIQVTDWTDDREPHDNPRNGCRVEAGTIQFQGHDAGTEILFRNIRILNL